ncbi:MAG: gfo/Idh/MocA family oxidoreductase [Candidatus Hydrogenedens sp.]|nr:gfo/Idh/MocA family oxidoreductase [Candidatus Hydrogenedens sp.]
MPNELNRRQFLDSAAVGTMAAAAALGARADAPFDRRVVVGVMGLMRGKAVAKVFAGQPNVEVRYACDVDRTRAADAAAELEKMTGTAPQAIGDFRTILDDPEVDALVCAAPNHWHAPATIFACQAGKHVYVEKPCCHNPQEGEWMVEAARKHGRVVQVGTQRRSGAGFREAIGLLHAGEIGRVYSARATYAAARGSIGHGTQGEPPAELDYALWQGPAPVRPYVDNHLHYNWHWFWHYGNGELGNNGVHTLDLCRWGLGVDYPVRVTSSGGRYVFDDDQETPDTHTAAFEFEEGKSIVWQGHSCNPYGQDFVNFYGESGTLTLTSGGSYTLYDLKNKVVKQVEGTLGEPEHVTNFLAAVRSETPDALNCGVAEAYPSTLLCHLGNIAHRTGRSLRCDAANGHILDDADAMQYWAREYNPDWKPVV